MAFRSSVRRAAKYGLSICSQSIAALPLQLIYRKPSYIYQSFKPKNLKQVTNNHNRTKIIQSYLTLYLVSKTTQSQLKLSKTITHCLKKIHTLLQKKRPTFKKYKIQLFKQINFITLNNISKSKQLFDRPNTNITMLPSSQDKKMLIESMKKLTHHISNNPTRQRQIFDSLTKHDLLKIISNLSDDNQYLRRISSLLLVELFFNNQQIKQRFNKIFNIVPLEGRVTHVSYLLFRYVSTKYHRKYKSIHQLLKVAVECIELIKSTAKEEECDRFCWTINLDRKILQLEFLQYKKYSSFTFLDPSRNIFGFTYMTKERRQQLRKAKNSNNKSKEKSVKSIDSRGSPKKDHSGVNNNNSTSNSFYKNFMELKNRTSQSPTSSYRNYYDKKDLIHRPITSRNQKTQLASGINYKNQNGAFHNISHYGKSTNSKDTSPYNNKLETPLRQETYNNDNAYTYKSSLNQTLNLSPKATRSPINSSINSYKQQSSTYQIQSQRKPTESLQNRLKIRQTDYVKNDFNISYTNQRPKFTQTSKNSSMTSPSMNQHQKFYKRVKQILKR